MLNQRNPHTIILFEHFMLRPLLVLLQLVRGQVFVLEPSTFAPRMLCWVKWLPMSAHGELTRECRKG